MADSSEYFNIGSFVSCKTCFREELQGEVLAFDSHVKILTLKCPSSSGRPSMFDIRLVNLSYVSQVTVMKEAPVAALPSLPSLNLGKLNNRAKRSIDEKQKLLQAMQSGVTPDGQKLFLTIRKTIDEVSWRGANIVVMDQVVIVPPYLVNNVGEKDPKKEGSAKAVNHIKKIVEKHHKDQQQAVRLNNGTSSQVVPEAQPVAQST
ncbi:protein LSM12-like [Oratosquilla oratoria]|uniref:protein LSM12-like n=1 Tax=Oratosquilla oratoria TaxID=337810 RepID=UPI003F75E6FC